MSVGEDLKLLIKSINPTILMDAALTVAESKWLMADNRQNKTKREWVEDQAVDLFRQLNTEVNS